MSPARRSSRPPSRSLSRLFVVAVLALFALFSGGCSLTADRRDPGEVAVAFFEACDAGEYEEAERLASEGLIQQLSSGVGSFFGGFEGYCDFHTRDGQLEMVEELDEQVEGDRTNVDLGFRFSEESIGSGGFGSGPTARTLWPMSREEGEWKVASPD